MFINTGTDKASIQHDAIAAAQTVIVSLNNSTAGASNAAQFSNMIEFIGQGYNSGGSASVTNKFAMQVQSVSGSYTPTGNQGDGYLVVLSSYNGAAYSNKLLIDSAGLITPSGYTSSTGSYTSTTTVSPSWQNATLLNSWTNVSPTTAGYFKDCLGFVHLRGAVKSGTDGANIFTLPAGFRPGQQVDIGYIDRDDNTSGAASWVQIHTDGTTYATGSGHVASYMYLDTIVFPAEN